MSWNQWNVAPPIPPTSMVSQPPPLPVPAAVPSMGTYPGTAAPPSFPTAPPSNQAFNYAAMTPEQQYAIQQNWQQWQAYQQQYAQWHAQYGEQYQREMQAKLGAAAPQLPYTANTTQAAPVAPVAPVPQPIAPPILPAYNQVMPATFNTAPSFMNAPPPPPEQEPQKFFSGNLNRPPPPPQETKVDNFHGNQNKDTKSSSFDKDFKSSMNNNYSNNYNDSYGYGTKNDKNQSFDRDYDKNQSFDRNYDKNQSYDRNYDKNQSFDRGYDNQPRQEKQRNFENSNSGGNNRNSFGQSFQNRSMNSSFSKEDNTNDNMNEKSREEILFDEQFRKWEEEFENWKKANVNHPDRKAYREYEMKFEDCRRKLVERREQMRKRKLDQMQKSIPPLLEKAAQILDDKKELSQNERYKTSSPSDDLSKEKKAKTDNENKIELIMKDIDDRENIQESKIISEESLSQAEFLASSSSSVGGIPGLDLVINEEKQKQEKKDKTDEVVEIIDLEKQNEDEDVLKKKSDLESSTNTDNLNETYNSRVVEQKKIPSLFDMKIEKPNFSPPPQGAEPDREITESKAAASINEESNTSNSQPTNVAGVQLPDNITKALQDPSVLALLSSALKGNPFDSNENKMPNSIFGNDNKTDQELNFRSQSRDFSNNFQNNNNNNNNNSIWNNQDNRRQDWLARNDNNFSRFGNDFSNNMNQRNRFDDTPSPWKNFDRNDNRGSNFYNNERNRGGGNYGDRRFNDSDKNDQTYRDNDNSDGFNPFKQRDFEHNRNDSNERKMQNSDSEDRNRNERGRDRDRNSNRNDQNDRRNNRSRSGNKNNRSRSNNQNNRFEDSGDVNPFNSPDKGSASNPFRRGDSNMFGSNNRNQQSDDYFKPAQVIDYQNKSMKPNEDAKEIFPLAKVVDYGHKRSDGNKKDLPKAPNDDYFPMKTIDYGHASSKSDNKTASKPEQEPEQKTAPPSFGGGFGDFLASKTMSGGQENKNKVDDFKFPVTNSPWIMSKSPDYHPSTTGDTSAVKRSNSQIDIINSNEGFLNANNADKNIKNIKNIYDYQNQQNYNIFGRNSNRNSMKMTDTDRISEENDENCSNIRTNTTTNSVGNVQTNANTSAPLTNFIGVDTATTTTNTSLKSGSFNEFFMNAPPPPLIGSCMPRLQNVSVTNKPTYSYNHNFQNNFTNSFNSSNMPCSTSSSSLLLSSSSTTTTIHDGAAKPLAFPSKQTIICDRISVDEILMKPGRDSRPSKIAIILRGPPGCGKSYVAKLIKDNELEMKGSAPRILSIDDYFMNEVDKEERCPKTNRKIVKQELKYEFDKEMEPKYIECLVKSFKKTLSEGLFNFVIVDCHNHSVRQLNEFHSIAKAEEFTPYIVELFFSIDKCMENNVHNRSRADIEEIIRRWQKTPDHMLKLDIDSLLEKGTEIEEVEMEDAFMQPVEPVSEESSQQSQDPKNDIIEIDDETSNSQNFMDIIKSKWDVDSKEDRLARLDGVSKKLQKHSTIEDYLQMDGWEPPSSSSNNKKRVRWADIEEKREQDKMRAIGFVVGQTDWNRMMDPTGGTSALTKTKYIERVNKS